MPCPNEKATYASLGSLPKTSDAKKIANSGKTDARPKPSPSGRQSVLSKPPIRYRATPKMRPRKKRVLAVQMAGRCCRRSKSRDLPLCLEGSRRDQREVSHVAMMPPATPLRTGRNDSNSIWHLTPELSRAAKRHRLERLVRPPFPGTCARRATAQPLSRTVQHAPCPVLPERTMRAARNSHRTLSEAGPAGRLLRRVAPLRSRGASGPTADALTARAKSQAQQAKQDATSGREPLLQQCREQGLTPELSRAAKRRRLE